MTLSESYSKSKRYLVFFSGLLALASIIGVTLNSEQTLLAIDNPNAVDDVLFVIVAYYLSQIILFWLAQTDEVKSHAYYKLDFMLTTIIGLIATSAYLYNTFSNPIFQWANNLDPKYAASISKFFSSPAVLGIISGLMSTVGVVAAAALFNKILISSKNRRSITEQQLTSILIIEKWVLKFNPERSDGFKEIEFLESREIGDGKNKNEHTWDVKGKFLEIYNDKQILFSRFRYEGEKEIFVHTNDEDTISKNQTLHKLKNWKFRDA